MPNPIHVIWQSYRPETPPRWYWDTAMIEDLLAQRLWSPVGGHTFVCHEGIENLPADQDGAVICFPGQWQGEHVGKLSNDLAKLRWVILIIFADEESAFPAHLIKHPNMRMWIQTPIAGKHNFANHYLLVGYPTHAPRMIGEVTRFIDQKKRDWFFSGQVTHARREACVKELRFLNDAGRLNETAGFTQGLERGEYYAEMAAAKIAPAPAGPCTPDSFRLAEALEAGCIPIVDAVCPIHPAGYWDYVFGENPPFPVLHDWAYLPAVMQGLLSTWPASANKVFAWWQAYKRRLAYDMEQDLKDVIGEQLPVANHDQVSVVIPTSPIPSHPDTSMIEEVIGTVRFHFPNAEIFLMMDGVRPQMEHRRAQYEEYKRRLIWKCNHDWKNILPVVFDVHSQQAIMMRTVLDKYVKTPMVMFVEHDAPLVTTQKFIDWKSITEVLLSGKANMVRLYYFPEVLKEHMYLMRDTFEHGGSMFLQTVQYSQWPNVGLTEFYKTILRDHFAPDQRAMIETVMYSPVSMNPWDKYKIVIYRPEGNTQTFLHRNGRAGDPGEW